MSITKSFSDILNTSSCIDFQNISADVAIKLNNIVKDLQNQLFFDKELPHDHLMFILNNRKTIESKLLDVLFDRINELNLDENIRGQLITNIYIFSSYFFPVNISTNINPRYFNFNSSEESDVDDVTDDVTSDENDSYDDLEHQIIDYLEFEQFIAAMSDNTPINQYEYENNNNNNNNSHWN